MDPVTGAILVQGATQGLQFGLDAFQNKKNMELAKYQNQANIEMWERMNEYNLPIKQMERLKQAGINPHMAYAKGSISNSAGTPQKMERSKAQFNKINPVDLTLVKQLQKMDAEIGNIEEDTRNKEIYGRVQVQREAKLLMENSILKLKEQWSPEYFRLDAQLKQSNIDNINSIQGLNETNRKIREKEFEWLDKKLRQEFTSRQLHNEYQSFINVMASAGIDFKRDSLATRMTFILLKEQGLENWNTETQLIKELASTVLETLTKFGVGGIFSKAFGKAKKGISDQEWRSRQKGWTTREF